jgi:hypothetical protein
MSMTYNRKMEDLRFQTNSECHAHPSQSGVASLTGRLAHRQRGPCMRTSFTLSRTTAASRPIGKSPGSLPRRYAR